MRKSAVCASLAPDFAQKMVDAEIELMLATGPNQQLICNLLQLYTTGFSYYQATGSPKMTYFQFKMKELFEMISQTTKFKPVQPSNLSVSSHQISTQEQVSKLVQSNQFQQSKMAALISKQISQQEENVNKKILQRKRRLLTKSMSVCESTLHSDETTDSLLSSENSSPLKRQIQPLKVNFEYLINEDDNQ